MYFLSVRYCLTNLLFFWKPLLGKLLIYLASLQQNRLTALLPGVSHCGCHLRLERIDIIVVIAHQKENKHFTKMTNYSLKLTSSLSHVVVLMFYLKFCKIEKKNLRQHCVAFCMIESYPDSLGHNMSPGLFKIQNLLYVSWQICWK